VSAVISSDGRYRYRLDRLLAEQGPNRRTMMFIMVNPSTADASENDPTIRRCINFALREDCATLLVGNLFAYRATDVKELGRAYHRGEHVVGPDNDIHLRAMAKQASLIVLGWGPLSKQPPELRHRWTQVVAQLAAETGDVARLLCLGRAKDGHPRHPLMLASDAPLAPWHPPGTPRDILGRLSGRWGGDRRTQPDLAGGQPAAHELADPQARWPGWPDAPAAGEAPGYPN
jgi:hypothetical protein